MKTMNKTILALAALAFAILPGVSNSAQAGQESKSFKEELIVEDTSLFRDQELQLDLFFGQMFGPGASGYTTNTGPGGGVAVNGIFARYFGLGVENFWYSNDNEGNYFLSGYLIARYPIESINVAPYMLVGGGAGFGDPHIGFGTLGGGFEHRWTPNIGAFVDSRWLYGAPNNAALLRTGLRFSF